MMNKQKLRKAEGQFLQLYPDGFMHPEMQEIGKKHRVDKMIALAKESFSKSRFEAPQAVAENMAKVVSRSSVVSMFEKPRFRDAVRLMDSDEKSMLASALKKRLHGNRKKGFEELVQLLLPYKLAKWSLVSILPNYYWPDKELFVKPTTTKGIIQHFELKGLEYKPQPSWDFYQGYSDAIMEMKSMVAPCLAHNNIAFTGFLMMSLEK